MYKLTHSFMNMAVFRYLLPWNLVESFQHFRTNFLSLSPDIFVRSSESLLNICRDTPASGARIAAKQPRNGMSIPGIGKTFFVRRNVETGTPLQWFPGGSFRWSKAGVNVKLGTYLRLVPRLRMSGTVPHQLLVSWLRSQGQLCLYLYLVLHHRFPSCSPRYISKYIFFKCICIIFFKRLLGC